MGSIFAYYVVATLLPIDKVIGRLYPIFGALLRVDLPVAAAFRTERLGVELVRPLFFERPDARASVGFLARFMRLPHCTTWLRPPSFAA